MDLPLTYYRATCTPNDIQKVTQESYGKVGTRHDVSGKHPPHIKHPQIMLDWTGHGMPCPYSTTNKKRRNNNKINPPSCLPGGIHFTISNYYLAEILPIEMGLTLPILLHHHHNCLHRRRAWGQA